MIRTGSKLTLRAGVAAAAVCGETVFVPGDLNGVRQMPATNAEDLQLICDLVARGRFLDH